MQELIDMLKDCKQALNYVNGHINANTSSTDIQHWIGVRKRLKDKIKYLEECIHNGEFDK